MPNNEIISYIQIGENTHPIIDATVPLWAKTETKPEYTAEEVGALPNSTIIPSVDSYFDNVEYDSQNKRINFKHGTTVKKYIDVSDFIKDGMVDNVTVLTTGSDSDDTGTLVVTFNTDAGKEDIEIPLSQIFEPGNYYTKRRADQIFVKYNTAQNLNDSHKAQARQNIGAGILNAVTFNGTAASVSNGIAAISVSIPAEVTEATITGWGFTKNEGTLTSESDPVFVSSAAYSITTADISNWNSKTSNTGTLTGVTFNSTAASVSNGIASISVPIPTVSELVDELSSEFVKKPDVIYQFESGYSPIYGQGSDSFTNNWDLTNLNLSPYKYLKVFIKGSDHATNANALTAPIIITIPLDEGIIYSGTTVYYGVGVTLGINDQNRWFATFAGVDSTKTKFQILRTRSIYGTVGSNQDNNGRYLWRIEGWYDSQEAGESGSSSFTELDPTVPSYIKNILQSDIQSWNDKVSNVQADWNTSDSSAESFIKNKPSIPSEVTESTVAGWGFTKNTGTLTSESDPVFVSSAAYGITAADISNWNSKTSNTGTLTGVTFNGVSASISNGIAAISASLPEGLPAVSASDNGKILMVENGAWTKKSPVYLYSGNGTPSNTDGYDGDLYIDLS